MRRSGDSVLHGSSPRVVQTTRGFGISEGQNSRIWLFWEKFLYMSCQDPTVSAIIIVNLVQRGDFMAKAIIHYISELLLVYQAHTQKTCSEMALDFDIALSNLYLYRNETGNPRAKTIDKIINKVETDCPEAFREVRWS